MEQKTLIAYKQELDDGFAIEYEVLPPVPSNAAVAEINTRIADIDSEVAKLNTEIDRLTNHADGLDYTIAVASGIFCGMIDSFFVGEFNFSNAKEWSNKTIDDFVVKTAKNKGYNGNNIEGAIKYLEEKFPLAADGNTSDFGGGLQHHLRDFSHHPTPVGWFFSMLTQFTGKIYGTNTAGVFMVVSAKDTTYIGKNLPEKFFFGTVYWFFHMVSDIAGSSGTRQAGEGLGTGLPGPIVSLLKEISSLPFFKYLRNDDGKGKFSEWISKLFDGTLLAKYDKNGKIIPKTKIPFDLRSELAVAHELTRQAIPVVINECIVRAFYFIRRLCTEIKENKVATFHDLKRIKADKVLPFKNRTIVRMLTIATGTFTTVDLADAAIRSVIKNGVEPTFWKDFILRVNFVGIGRFAIAVGTDVGMGVKKSSLENKRMVLLSEQIELLNARVFYYQADMWVQIENTERAVDELLKEVEQSFIFVNKAYDDMSQSVERIGQLVQKAEQKNPGLTKDLLNAMW